MKTVFILLATVFPFSAHALESFYGQLSYSKGEYHCTFKNDGIPKNFKYVIFTLESRTGSDSMAGVNFQSRVDTVVAPYETIVAHSGVSMVYKDQYCRFLAK
ncbi:hypothetical protein D3C72_1748650 [compost metagenome]